MDNNSENQFSKYILGNCIRKCQTFINTYTIVWYRFSKLKYKPNCPYNSKQLTFLVKAVRERVRSIIYDQAVSVVVVVIVVVVVGVNFFRFSTSSLKLLHGFASNFVWMFLGWTPTNFVKIRVLPLFFMELWGILCNFWPILRKTSSIKPLTRNHSYLV